MPCSAVPTLLQKVRVLPEHAEMLRERERERGEHSGHPSTGTLPAMGREHNPGVGGGKKQRETPACSPAPVVGSVFSTGEKCPAAPELGIRGHEPRLKTSPIFWGEV